MEPAIERSLDGLLIVNVGLAVICLTAVVAVAVAVVLDLRERRRRRVVVPPCWPPPGVDPAEAYADDMVPAGTARAATPSHREGGNS